MTVIKSLDIQNVHLTGIGMKELVRRAINVIRNQAQAFEVTAKMGYSGDMDDVLTSADNAAQEVYLKSLRECFPHCGVVAEEDSLTIPCTDGTDTFFTVDPLDGTKAFVRRQSHGVGTMISLSQGKEFLAAFIGDINTQEIYGFRPNSNRVHRISGFQIAEELTIKPQSLHSQYVMLRDPADQYSPLSQQFIRRGFKSQIVDGGSIGTWMARLWKGEVGAALLLPGHVTPWDDNPVNAISLKLGFVFCRPSSDQEKWIPYAPLPQTAKSKRKHDVLVVHQSNIGEVRDPEAWIREKAAIEDSSI